jgi:putative flippase GtrA
MRYSMVGTAGTALYVGLYLLLNIWTPAIVGNGLAWVVTTLATNGVQRRVAFGVPDGDHAGVDRIVGLVSSGVALLATTVALNVLQKSGSADQVVALVAVNAIVGTARFLTVRSWFGRRNRQILPI